MSETKSTLENYEKIIKASIMEADEILFKNLSNRIEFRKKCAIEMLNCKDEQVYENLKNTYDWVELEMKKLLGI
jgi:hypothetical protein